MTQENGMTNEDKATSTLGRFDVEHLKTGQGKRAFRGSFLVLASQAIKVVLFLASLAVLSRWVPPEEFGVVALVLPVFYILLELCQSSLGQVIVQRAEINEAEASGVFWGNTIVGLVLAGVMIASGFALSLIYGDQRTIAIAAVLAVPVLVSAPYSVYLGILTRQMMFKHSALVSIFAEMLAVCLAITAALNGWSYWAIIVQLVARSVASILLILMITKWVPLGISTLKTARQTMKMGGNLATFSIFTQIGHSLGPLIVGGAFGQVQASLFFRAWNVSMWPTTQVIGPLTQVLTSSLSRAADNPNKMQSAYLRIVVVMGMIAAPLGAVVSGAAEPIIELLLGDQWLEAVPYLTWFGLMVFSLPFASSINWFLIASGRTEALARYGILSLGVILLGYLVGIQFGIIGVAAVHALAGIFVRLPLLAFLAQRFTKDRAPFAVGPFFRTFSIFLVEACLLVLLLNLLTDTASWQLVAVHPALELGISACLVGIIHLCFCLALPASRREIIEILRMAAPFIPGIRKYAI